ncbi:hypothetical protein RYZ26_05480 [Terasakiella sp. A23]|uniref:hypothetical protein n=1 Tax=Terasakiella sp. FCG-A23 TaxID=3080561 RepID=UPI0029530182|nr:hypothetical protein [Terasakiella sp. A23]MDV7339032.1 hypothetical protein [Terasakiella sp. A23]
MRNAMDQFELAENAILARRAQFPEFTKEFEQVAIERADEVRVLEEDGFLPYGGYIEKDRVKKINDQFESWARQGVNLQLPRDIAARKPGQEDWDVGRISQEDVEKGLDAFAHRTHMVQLQDPLMHFPDLLRIGLDEKILDIVGAYMGCLPSMGFLKITKSLANDLPPFDTQLYHIDGNAAKMVKAFLLLHDVDEGTGPHALVKNSHKDRFEGCFDKIRWTEEEMVHHFGEDRILHHHGKAGDLVVEDTSAFHCGQKPTQTDRTIVIFNYVPHEEYGGGGPKLRAPKFLLDELSEKQRLASDEIEFV